MFGKQLLNALLRGGTRSLIELGCAVALSIIININAESLEDFYCLGQSVTGKPSRNSVGKKPNCFGD